MSTYTLVLQTISSLTGIATSTSMIIAYRQWRLATRHTQTTFEDALAREYRQVSHRLPLKALLGEQLDAAEWSATLATFYWYFDLTNEQVFLRRNGRLSEQTWHNWSDGIRTVMRLPAFERAWGEIKSRAPGTFADLRRFSDEGFAGDPAAWGPEDLSVEHGAIVRRRDGDHPRAPIRQPAPGIA